MDRIRIPGATYRVQFHGGFDFARARAVVPYLDALGITDLYASPLLQARRGSTHGYDVTDHARLDGDLGPASEFDGLAADLRARGMGLLLDIVPNHMAASSENGWWRDVLQAGEASPWAHCFDIDWHPNKRALDGKVLLPILARPYARALEARDLVLVLEPDGFFVDYFGNRLPLAPRTYGRVLGYRIEELERDLGTDHPAFRALWEAISAAEHLAAPALADPDSLAQRRDEEERARLAPWKLRAAFPEVRAFLDRTLATYNGRAGAPASLDLLDRLLTDQPHWLSYWRLANEAINYRRFFAISELVSLRVEAPDVFDASHSLVLRLAAEGKVTGFRIDHIDGLLEPLEYLKRLQARVAPDAPPGAPPGFYVVVEKILSPDEPLPAEWPVHGTTGYDFLNLLNGVFVAPAGVEALGGAYERFLGEEPRFADVAYRCKRQVLETLFAGEMHALADMLARIAEQDRYARDLPLEEMRRALVEVTACFPVYRSYVAGPAIGPRDRRYLGGAILEAQERNPRASRAVHDFLRHVLLLETDPPPPPGAMEERLRFVQRWQQYTGPIMAKGVEDTALYRFHRLDSLNEVGGDPASPGTSLPLLHRELRARAERRPHGLNATSTHDTKRGEDVRARLNVLSELPQEWDRLLERWGRWNAGRRTRLPDGFAPDRNDETLIYQTLLGAWPLDPAEEAAFPGRVRAYLRKALREAKVHTDWIHPVEAYEAAVERFLEGILDPVADNRFLETFRAFQARLAHLGAINGLAQVVLKAAAPGVPDFYQGTELWDLDLVDPDNRRPVDFERRAALLADLEARERLAGRAALASSLLEHWPDGRVKLYVTWRSLQLRRRLADAFRRGAYLGVRPTGPHAAHVAAFARRDDQDWAIAVAPRLLARVVTAGRFPVGNKVWGTTTLVLPAEAPVRWRDEMTGEVLAVTRSGGRKALRLDRVLRTFPVALLVGEK